MKTKNSFASLSSSLGLLIIATTSSHAALITVGVYDEQVTASNTIEQVALGSTLNLSQLQTRVSDAFANNTGGVWNFDTVVSGEWDGAGRTSYNLTYGTSQAKTLGLTLSENVSYNTSATNGFSISGGGVLGLPGAPNDRVFTPSKSLTMVSITELYRTGGGTMSLIATLADNSTIFTTATATTAGDTLHSLTASASNPIVSFTLDLNGNYIRFDDLAFEVVPEPTTTLLSSLGVLLLLRRRR